MDASVAGTPGTQQATLLIHNALLVPTGERAGTPFHGWIYVAGTRIRAVGTGEPPMLVAGRTIDAGGHALLPGFVNTHAHSHSSLTRGSAEGLELERWIATIEREQRILNDEDAHAAALATYAEALLSGTTSILDMCLRPVPALRAARDIGIRCTVAPYVLDGRDFAPTLDDVAALLCADTGTTSRVWVGLHDLESCSDRTLVEGAGLAARHGVGLHLHCAESRHAADQTRRRTGVGPVTHLHRLGLLGSGTVLAHGVWVDEAEARLLAQAGASVAHCPHANLKLASGIAPVPMYGEAGVRVTLATDGAKANNRLDMFDVMKFASLIHKGRHLDASLLPPQQILDMATADGADALGLAAGRLVPGMLADLVLVNVDQFHLQPATPATIRTNLVHAARGGDVHTVIVDGRVVVENGRLALLDQDEILAAMRHAGARLMAG